MINLILLFIPFGSLYTMYRVQATLNDIWDKAAQAPAQQPARAAAAEEKPAEKSGERVYIKCSRCKTRNLEDANYCVKCGENLQK